MYKLIGNKESFAVEIEILRIEEFNKQCWIKSRLWIGGSPIGVFDEDENYLWPFLQSLCIIAEESGQFWDYELEGLNCKETFFTINPFFGKYDEYMNLSDEEAANYEKYEKYKFVWGENFDQWKMSVVINDEYCTFFWLPYWNEDGSKNNDYNDYVKVLQCFKVPLSEVQSAYREVYAMVPDEYWSNVRR